MPETLRTSRGLLMFVEEPAEAVVSLDLGDLGRRVVGECPCARRLPQTAMRAVVVVTSPSRCWKIRYSSRNDTRGSCPAAGDH